LFEQFFTPQLSRQLQAEPGLLTGKDTQVTLLCCNIRGFSHVSEQLGARLTIDWISDVMGTLSGCVTSHDGVLVDTLGDELIGMWGAPIESTQHARQASQAAFDMLEELPALNRRWQSALDRPIEIGAGLHTGFARVGNIGSVHKLKYGPLGRTVTIVRQVAALTEQYRANLLTTAATISHLDRDSPTRRLGNLEDEDSAEAIAIYELATDVSDDWAKVKRFYESALKSFQRNDLTTATKMLGRLLADHPGDYPALQLLAKIAAMSE
jgi:class 3 adenylate cyclase